VSKKYKKPLQNQNQSKNGQPKKPNNVLDIIIPVYNQFDFLEKCLDSIPNSVGEIPYRVILVDNGSDKKLGDEFYDNLKIGNVDIHRSDKNAGFPVACNYGVSQGNAPFLFFLNTDVVLFPQSLQYALRAIEDPRIGIVGLKLLFSPHTPFGPAGMVQHVGVETNIRGEFYHQFIGWNPNNPRVLKKRECLAVTGAAFLIRSSTFQNVGGFDQIFGLGTWEDIDLSLKVKANNLSIIVEQQAQAYHHVGASSMGEKVPFPFQRNKDIFMAKWSGNFPWSEWAHY